MGQAAGGTAGEDQTDLRPGLRGEGGQGKQEQQYEQQAAHENDPEPGERRLL